MLCDTPPALGFTMLTDGALPEPLLLTVGWLAGFALGSACSFCACAGLPAASSANEATAAAKSFEANAVEMPRVLAITATNSLFELVRALPAGAPHAIAQAQGYPSRVIRPKAALPGQLV